MSADEEKTLDPNLTINRTLDTIGQHLLGTKSDLEALYPPGEMASRLLPNLDLRLSESSYRMLCPFAEGGFGEVWIGEQSSLKRVVAIKMLRETRRMQADSNPQIRDFLFRSFLLEAITTAQLDHPNIVPVHDISIGEDGWPILAMKLVKGESWRKVLAEDYRTLSVDEYLSKHLDILITVMQAVAFAHSRGVVHRDIKPEQVMIGEFGQIHLMDWGLAMSVLDEERQREEGAVYFSGIETRETAPSPGGTPAYMAPEQTLEHAKSICFQTDVYLLGGILYGILTGKPPRTGNELDNCLSMAARGEYDPLEKTGKDRVIPPDLARIVQRALQPKPANRIQSVVEFIEEIQNYLSGKSNLDEATLLAEAAETRLTDLVARSANRERGDVAGIYSGYSECLYDLDRARSLAPRVVRILPLREKLIFNYAKFALREKDLKLARGLVGLLDEEEERQELLRELQREELRLEHRENQRRVLKVSLVAVISLLIIGSITYIFHVLDSRERLMRERDHAREATIERELALRTAEEATARSVMLQELAEREQYFANIETTTYSIERALWEKARNNLLTRTPPHLRQWEWGHLAQKLSRDLITIQLYDAINFSKHSPDGTEFYTTSRDGRITVWDASTGAYLRTLQAQEARVHTVSLSPDGNRLVTTSHLQYPEVLDTQTGELLFELAGHTGLLTHALWSPCGDYIATSSMDETVLLWEADSGTLIRRLDGFTEGATAIAFNHTGLHLTIGTGDGGLYRHNIDSEETWLLNSIDEGRIDHLEKSLDSGRLLVLPMGGPAQVLDNNSLEKLREVGSSNLAAVCFADNDRFIITVDNGRFMSIHDGETGDVLTEAMVPFPINSVDYSDVGETILVGTRSHATLFNLASLLERPDIIPADPTSGDFNEFDTSIRVYGLTPGRDPGWQHRERIWNTAAGRTFVETNGFRVSIESRYSDISPDGRWRFEMDPETFFSRVYSLESDEIVYTHPESIVVNGEFSPDGSMLMIAEAFNRIHVLETGSWKSIQVFERDESTLGQENLARYIPGWAAFSPDSRSVVVAYLNGKVVSWDVNTGAVNHESEPTRGIGATISFDGDGSRFLVGGNDHRTTLWETDTGEKLGAFIGHTAWVTAATFSPDGERVITASRDQTVRVWEADSQREIMVLYQCPPDATIVAACFIGDGTSALVVLDDGRVKTFETVPWEPGIYEASEDGLTPEEEFELAKRRRNIGDHITPNDVGKKPVHSNL
ncbi:MAG: protein kinase [Candidatus Sumerlaeia bacterium]|nr:protein kinase [Candidatus Sumerlaeia bacterium]